MHVNSISSQTGKKYQMRTDIIAGFLCRILWYLPIASLNCKIAPIRIKTQFVLHIKGILFPAQGEMKLQTNFSVVQHRFTEHTTEAKLAYFYLSTNNNKNEHE